MGLPLSVSEGFQNWIFVIAAGLFIYIALAEMVIIVKITQICAFIHEIFVNFTTGAGVSCAAGGQARVRCDDSAGDWNHNWNRDSPRDCSLRREATHLALKGVREERRDTRNN